MNIDRFLAEKFQRREKVVPVPELAEWFEEGEPAEWTVRQLTAGEFGGCLAAAQEGEQGKLQEFYAALQGRGDLHAAILKAANLDPDEVPMDVSRRLGELFIGSVNPPLAPNNRDVAVKLAENFPLVFFRITNEIRALTDAGAEVGKPSSSGATPA